MIQFKKLRLNGFKSFVDRTELEIGPGLNGIVGPNGCGKSNLLEALRWAMGESSAKRMRSGGMDDVIFSGSEKRSARNIAEVSILLDNSAHQAPAAYNKFEDIEIVRRIERDRGSNYKINGKNVRARDVQMLFADTVTGANSPAMVSQGRVAEIINAKPLDRRMILEESAGISGLYARRHEAELRLRAADKNLVRIEDILGGMEGRLNSLKRQARQAGRYRNAAAQIRQLELLIACLEWGALDERTTNTRKSFEDAESIVAQKMVAVTQLTKTQNAQVEELQPLRDDEAAIAAKLQTQKLALQRLEDEAARRDEVLNETREQLQRAKNDAQHEQHSLSESTAGLEKLDGEQKTLLEKQDGDEGALEKKQKARDEIEEKVITLEEKYRVLMQGEAESKARQQSLRQQIEQNESRIETLRERLSSATQELEELQGKNTKKDVVAGLRTQIESLEKKAETLEKDLEATQGAKEKASAALDMAREGLKESESKASEARAEISMLESFIAEQQDGSFNPVLDSVVPESGFETALSRALGDSLMASLDEAAPVKWLNRKAAGDMPALPAGADALLPHVEAPKELHLALSQIGIVEDEAAGMALMDQLLPGQSLVSPAGLYWRWDGLFMQAEASDRNALHLEHKNKLAALEAKRPALEKAVESAQTSLDKVKESLEAAEEKQSSLQGEIKETHQALSQVRDEMSGLHEEQARYESETKRLSDVAAQAKDDIKTLEDVIKWDKDRLQAYEEESAQNKSESIEDIKLALTEARDAYQDAIRSFDIHQQEQNSRKARLHAIADERINLQNRAIRSRERLKELEERKAQLEEKLKLLSAKPKQQEKAHQDLLDTIATLEKERDKAAEKLSTLDSELQETARALKTAESNLGEAKEARARAEATLSGIKEQQDHMRAAIQEQFDIAPEELKTHTAIDLEKNTESLESLKQQKEKLIRERDNIGPVNLRAEEEAAELEAEVGTLLHERNDLIAAIEELRAGIQKINKEARLRLVGAFEHVNAHFQRLFAQLFPGGKAHLALVDGEGNQQDDPLEAGLEIFAQPPGKALQSLSLLSGGEQALTSIALIFGMFLTNPSPVCVLDEIDAPLDDANVDRVCNLLEEIAQRGETRFLIITHHRMTMARMDRLYGVTMQEKGVSQLVSVDLQQSFAFLDEAA